MFWFLLVFFFLTVVEIGFTIREARLGLRTNQGNVEKAAEYIMKDRQVCSTAADGASAEQSLNNPCFIISPNNTSTTKRF